MTGTLTPEQIQQRINQPPPDTAKPKPRRYIRPLQDIADDLVEQIQNVEGRFEFGILRLDTMIRGLRPGDLCIFTGKSHQGKSQVLLNAVANNPQARILWVTPDEMGELVLMKLMSMVDHIDPQQLEDKLQAKDPDMLERVGSFKDRFPNFHVVDKTVSAVQLEVAIHEAHDDWGQPPQLVVYDYLELMPTDGEGYGSVTANAQALKAIAKEHAIPMVVVHQASRSGGKRGQSAGIDGMRYGGEAEATVVVECYRKTDDDSLDEYERGQQAHTVSVNVVKNKHPPCHKGEHDFYLHPDFGYMREIQAGDIGTPREHDRIASQGEVIARLAAGHSAHQQTPPPPSPQDDGWEDF